MNLNKPARLCVETSLFPQFSRKKASGAARWAWKQRLQKYIPSLLIVYF